MDELSTPYSPGVKFPTDLVSMVESSKSPNITVTSTSDMEMSTSTITSSLSEVDKDLYELQRTSSSLIVSSVVMSNITSSININKQQSKSKVDFNGDDVSPLSSYLSKRTIRTIMMNSNYTQPLLC